MNKLKNHLISVLILEEVLSDVDNTVKLIWFDNSNMRQVRYILFEDEKSVNDFLELLNRDRFINLKKYNVRLVLN